MSAASAPLLLAADVWCPFNCAASQQPQGFMIDIATRVFAREGIEVRYVNLPWPRAKARVSEGLVHGLVGATRTDPDTQHLHFPSLAQGQMRNLFWVRAGDDWRYLGPMSLAERKLGVIKDYEYGAIIDGYIAGPGVRVHLASGSQPLQQLMRMLQSGRIDLVIEDQSVFTYTAASHAFSAFSAAGPIPGSEQGVDLYIAFSPTAEGMRYAKLLSEGTARLRKQGELAKIMAKYGLQDWHAGHPIPPLAVN
ncbi:transporter substrate-binding domain-containing protein [Simiduia sp. 21SJ11W-1]|uniref:substrate-binding periplasmic protein n=1 Tax=Simiduia sp. 21SJ11W-1 TaxID=2909669 RepID=UPI00209EC318|nr:transporter substrate-binding domain-containing protein [Simiduia sp. 21SJ11W-1]UTA47165.1 transporter substrate-binding domain-containing protein [Simiduia sp. 21SJ11W-1]